MSLFNFVNNIQRRKSKRDAIQNNPEKKKTSVYFGVTAIFNEIFTSICIIAALFLVKLMGGDNAILVVFGALFGIVFGIAALALFINAIINTKTQFSINKKAVGYVSLAFMIIDIAVLVAGAVLILF